MHGGDLRAIKGRMLSHAKPVPLRSIAPDRLCLFRRSASHAQAATTRQFEMDGVIMTVLVQVINLDRSPERLRAIGADLALAGLEWTRLPAIEPDKDYATTLPSYQRARAHYLFGRDLTRGEVGCFASHLMALRALVNSGYETGLILEDDAQPDQDMGQTITDIATALASTSPNWACVNLSYTTRLRRRAIASVASNTLYRAYQFPLLTSALLWRRDHAKSFVDWCDDTGIYAPCDNQLRDWIALGNIGISCEYPPVGLRAFASTIADRPAAASSRKGMFGGSKLSVHELRQKLPLYWRSGIAYLTRA